MKNCFSNATVWWTEREIAERDALTSICYQIVKDAWTNLNPAVQFARIESPIMTPLKYLEGHVNTGFPMLQINDKVALRPETTAGTIEVFHQMFPQKTQRMKRLPMCIWQVGKSFRDEDNPETMRATKLRLREFYQLEFQLFTSEGTKADYLMVAIKDLVGNFGGEWVMVGKDDLPHYSTRTVDWEIEGLEVAGCSRRIDWEDGILFEISIGLDRLVNVI